MANRSRLLLSIFILAGFVVFGLLWSSISRPTIQSVTGEELSLRQAVDLANQEVLKWNSKAQLANVISVDNPETSNKIDGNDGKRRYWNLQYVVQSEKKSMGVTIHDGQIINKWSGQENSDRGFDIQGHFDSSDALKKAIALYDIHPGKGWAGGFHYQLTKQNKMLVMTVFGRDSESNFSRVDFDILTGQVVSALRKIPYGGGLYSSNSNSPLFNDSHTILVGSAISPNFVSDKTIFIWGVRNDTNSSFLKMSKDGGSSWVELNVPKFKSVVNVQFSNDFINDHTVYLTTNKQVLMSESSGDSWKEIFNSKQEIISSNFVTNKFTILTNNNDVLVSTDGGKWVTHKTPEGVTSVLINSKGNLILRTSNNIYTSVTDSWNNLKIPFEKPYGEIRHYSNKLMIYSSNKVGLLDESTGKWSVFNTLYQIDNAWLVQESTNDPTIYAQSKNGEIFRIQKGGGSFQVNIPTKGSITQILSSPNKLFYLMVPTYEWENWEKG